MKTTPIDEIEDMADGVPVLAVEGTVKYAQEVKSGASAAGHAWTKQFFVLTNGTAEIACSMWDAEGNELSKGEQVHIENTQNKKGAWSGMIKGSYQKNGERKHTLEIRANQVKIKSMDAQSKSDQIIRAKTSKIPKRDLQDADPYGQHGEVDGPPLIDPDWPEAPATAPESQRKPNDNGLAETRLHLMQSCHLYTLCVDAVNKVVMPHIGKIGDETLLSSEMFQAAVGTLYIECSRSGFISKMPKTPI